MSSRVLTGLLAAGCITAAAGGAYVAGRQNATAPVPVAAASPAAPAQPATRPVTETEAIVGAPTPSQPAHAPAAVPTGDAPAEAPRAAAPKDLPHAPAPAVRPAPSTVQRVPAPSATRRERDAASPSPSRPVAPSAPVAAQTATPPVSAQPAEPEQEQPRATEVAVAPRAPQFEEVVLPASSVIGLEVDTALSSERARVEDRVEARVTRDVMSGGRVAIPAGSRVIGAVTLVERGGKVKQAARLGVRFHTLVLADGNQVSLSTEPVYREGESPAADSARKIGGAAVGGAILGAIIGGGKGAVIGGATGAAGGSAVVMSGDRNAATLASGSLVTVRLSGPATIDVEKREPQD
jgi:type IV secretory pathway VirB10-like protein